MGVAMMVEFDGGPPMAVARHFAQLPSYAEYRTMFWHDWGPIFYRGRLNRSGRLLAVASDPGPTERIAGRTLVGDAGQRVQGFLTKLGLTSSYTLVNAYAFALLPSHAQDAIPLLSEPDQLQWRNTLLELITGPKL
jgi:uracil-DNA glycosylase